MPGFRVALEVFEGPLDLLLTLVRRESLEITQVALAEVTDQYLSYLSALEAIDPGPLAEFCDIAGTLLLIKSRALLPREADRLEDEADDAQALIERLKAYRRFRAAADRLGAREAAGLRAYVRTAPPPDLPPRYDSAGISPADLAAAFRQALAEAEQAEDEAPEPPRGVRPHRMRLADRLGDIRQLLGRKRRVTFRDVLLGGRPEGSSVREFVIVSFLAVLEMLRRHQARAIQDELFGEIVIEAQPALDQVLADPQAATTEEVFTHEV